MNHHDQQNEWLNTSMSCDIVHIYEYLCSIYVHTTNFYVRNTVVHKYLSTSMLCFNFMRNNFVLRNKDRTFILIAQILAQKYVLVIL